MDATPDTRAVELVWFHVDPDYVTVIGKRTHGLVYVTQYSYVLGEGGYHRVVDDEAVWQPTEHPMEHAMRWLQHVARPHREQVV